MHVSLSLTGRLYAIWRAREPRPQNGNRRFLMTGAAPVTVAATTITGARTLLSRWTGRTGRFQPLKAYRTEWVMVAP
jgi:hypothetical protein